VHKSVDNLHLALLTCSEDVNDCVYFMCIK
jgi:hypothetical protein